MHNGVKILMEFGEGSRSVEVDEKLLDEVSEKALQAAISNLPDEYITPSVIKYVLEHAWTVFSTTKIKYVFQQDPV